MFKTLGLWIWIKFPWKFNENSLLYRYNNINGLLLKLVPIIIIINDHISFRSIKYSRIFCNSIQITQNRNHNKSSIFFFIYYFSSYRLFDRMARLIWSINRGYISKISWISFIRQAHSMYVLSLIIKVFND